jgi:hypothetical protein
VSTDLTTRDAPLSPARQPAGGDRPLKILVFASSLEAGAGGSRPLEFANGLVAEGHAVLLAASLGALRVELEQRVAYLVTDDARHARVKVAHELSRYLRHHHPDVVHAFSTRCALVAAVAVNASHAPCIRVMTHDARVTGRRARWIARSFMKRCADHYFATDADRKRDLERFAIPEELTSLISCPDRDSTDAVLRAIAVYRNLLGARAAKA